MIAGTAGYDVHATHLGQKLSTLRTENTVQHPPACDALLEGVRHRQRLLVDFLLHEVAVATPFSGIGAEIAFLDRPLHLLGVAIVNGDAAPPHHGNVTLFQKLEAPSYRQQRRHIRRDKILIDAQPNNNRAAGPCQHHGVGIMETDDHQGVGTL